MNAISRLFGQFNLRIFELLILEVASVRDLAKIAKCSPAKISQFVELYLKKRLVVVEKNKNRKIIALNRANPLVREMITLVYLNKILDSKSFRALKKISDSIGLYGSVVEGTVDRQSDIDLWVISDARKRIVEVGKLRQEFSNEIKKEVSLKFLTRKDVEKLKQNDKIFYNELECKSRILYGEMF